MKYIHSLLAIPHHQLKVNRKFNVNFNLNMKYDSAMLHYRLNDTLFEIELFPSIILSSRATNWKNNIHKFSKSLSD